MNAPLIFFVHVPKTAGSTVNAILKREEPNGAEHTENLFQDLPVLRSAAERFVWMSGHVDLSTAMARLREATDRPVRFFTCMREPPKQVASHYNWLVEIFHRSPQFYAGHPASMRELSELIRSGPFDAETIISNLAAHQALFLNNQSRIVLGNDFRWSAESIAARLDRYEKIVLSSDVSGLLSAMLGRDTDTGERVNESKYRFDRSVFDTAEMQAFLAQWNARDNVLYRFLGGRAV
jgi:hypothetical protein